MKKILIAATTVGAAIAGIILYLRKTSGTKQLDQSGNGFQSLDASLTGERNMIHTMG